MINLLFSFFIYSFFFITIGNTVFRKDSDNNINFSLYPLMITGFIAPIRSVYNFLSVGEYIVCLHYLKFELTNLANPYTCYIYVRFADYLIN